MACFVLWSSPLSVSAGECCIPSLLRSVRDLMGTNSAQSGADLSNRNRINASVFMCVFVFSPGDDKFCHWFRSLRTC